MARNNDIEYVKSATSFAGAYLDHACVPGVENNTTRSVRVLKNNTTRSVRVLKNNTTRSVPVLKIIQRKPLRGAIEYFAEGTQRVSLWLSSQHTKQTFLPQLLLFGCEGNATCYPCSFSPNQKCFLNEN